MITLTIFHLENVGHDPEDGSILRKIAAVAAGCSEIGQPALTRVCRRQEDWSGWEGRINAATFVEETCVKVLVTWVWLDASPSRRRIRLWLELKPGRRKDLKLLWKLQILRAGRKGLVRFFCWVEALNKLLISAFNALCWTWGESEEW